MTEDQLLNIALAINDAARSAGADFSEVRVSNGRSTSVRLERSAIDSSEIRFLSGANIRCFVNGGLGSVSLDGLDMDKLTDGAQVAVAMASCATPDKAFVTLPGPVECMLVEDLYDSQIESMDVSAMSKIMMECVDAACVRAPDCICAGGAASGYGSSAIANSLGVARSTSVSSVSAWIEPIIKRGDDVGAFYDYSSARSLQDFHHVEIGASAADMAVKFLGARKIESGIMPVVLGPLSSRSVFGAMVSGADAESHQRGRSWLDGKLGIKVASSIVSVQDNASIPAGLGSRAYDSEGTPTLPINIIESGVLVNLLHNSYTANKANVPYTGHAIGGGIGSSNIVPTLGWAPACDIIKDVKRGLYINMGRLSPDSTTGEVSAMVDFGFMIENGEVAYPIASTMLGINGFDMLANIDAVSSDGRMDPGTTMPTIRIQGVRVAGGK